MYKKFLNMYNFMLNNKIQGVKLKNDLLSMSVSFLKMVILK
jgi:hypothetical protein